MEKINIRYLNGKLDDEYDFFICSASFETRCLTIPSKIRNKKFSKVLIMENIEGSELIKDNASKLNALFNQKAQRIKIDLRKSFDIAEKLSAELKIEKKRQNYSVLLDITAFTHEGLLVCLKVLSINSKIASITCLYNNAAEYCPNVELNKKWLSRGAGDIHPILGYPGMILPARKVHMVVIVGYEFNRAFQTISDIEPSSITLIYGTSKDSLTEKDKEANKFFNGIVEEMAFEYSDIETLEISCSDPDAIAEGLMQVYRKHEDKNVIVVPMNSKMSTLGVYLSLKETDAPQVCYAPAILYNEANYSTPGKDCCIYKLKDKKGNI